MTQAEHEALAKGPYAIDVETDEHDRARIVAVCDKNGPLAARVDAVVWKDHPLLTGHWVGHNIKADLVWLHAAGAWPQGDLDDTMLMAHLLDENGGVGLERLAKDLLGLPMVWKKLDPEMRNPKRRAAIPEADLMERCKEDAAATFALYHHLLPRLQAKPRLEAIYRHMSLPLMRRFIDVEIAGVPFNKQRAEALVTDLQIELAGVEADLDTFKSGVNWDSPDQVAAILYGEYGLKPPKMAEKKPRGSTDEESLMKLRDQHPIMPLLLRHRKLAKKEEMVVSWIKHVRPSGTIHPSFNVTGTETGRISVSRPNLQQMHTDEDVRSLIWSPNPGWVLLSADYKTIEIGTAAWIFDEPTMLAAYINDDVHTLTATRLLGRPPVDKDERKKYGKTPNFGLLYQQGDEGFRDYAMKKGVDMTLDEARLMRAQWHNLFPGVRAGWRRIGNRLTADGGLLTLPSGRERRLSDFMGNVRWKINKAWRDACNTPVQGTAGEFTHIAAILAPPVLAEYGGRLLLHWHDSLVFVVPQVYLDRCAALLADVMRTKVPSYFEEHFGTRLPIPLFVDVAAGPDLGHLAEIA
jgi:DNA polymerase-1